MKTNTDTITDTGQTGFVEAELVHSWRVDQLERCGVTHLLAELWADSVDYAQVRRLTGAGCPPLLALEISR